MNDLSTAEPAYSWQGEDVDKSQRAIDTGLRRIFLNMRGCLNIKNDCKCFAVVRLNVKSGNKQDIDYFDNEDDADSFIEKIIKDELYPEENILYYEEVKEYDSNY